ncbi:MAG: 4-(cytidine 5'-diphospho)-2-C-methyl-D-erythritol kinase [Candidatus Nanopelagicales bacterium]|jgi:4-diphosphocytidyl-2-C-methyl-D-erythritol kinase|nr:4-(cytidine 5'-diphospho)-2-C-methyl-D-erythritol kinase [Actinomycetes bacterium]MCH9831537.1 4-(cytidine 5'-diphospho)-2-C-methyl-D-erythritol kinase [Actinomycetes bacterium]MCH9840162.1 4-(cytidine 5'-diphospho)-2-C-methyl-D-erythritol kinase [Actinomycetes bacterium]
MSTRSVTVEVPAKINLALKIAPLGPDNFHQLVTVFHAVSLFDTVTASTGTTGVNLSIDGEGAHFLPVNSSNLAVKAAKLLARHHGMDSSVELHITKRIPISGGMAGGSADAAGALIACDRLWGANSSREELESLAAELGSDVAFLLHGGTALGSGRGELLTSVITTGEYHWVIALAEGGLSTPKVYAEFDALSDSLSESFPERPLEIPTELLIALRAGDHQELGASLANDLEPAALSLMPNLAKTLHVGVDLGALGALVSGSGPTCVFLVRSQEQAVSLAASLSGAGVCRSVRIASGPALTRITSG